MGLLLLLGEGSLLAQEAPRTVRGYVLQERESAVDQLITSKEELAKFLACIPENLADKRGRKRPNPDPLRGAFVIDFQKDVLVIAVHRDTLSAYPNYLGRSSGKKGASARFEIPERPPEAKPDGWGVYTGVVLPKSGAPTRIERVSTAR